MPINSRGGLHFNPAITFCNICFFPLVPPSLTQRNMWSGCSHQLWAEPHSPALQSPPPQGFWGDDWSDVSLQKGKVPAAPEQHHPAKVKNLLTWTALPTTGLPLPFPSWGRLLRKQFWSRASHVLILRGVLDPYQSNFKDRGDIRSDV